MAPEDPHILVVDDHREIRESLAQFLRKNGRRATAVDSAENARRAIKEHPVSYTHLRAHETALELVCSLLLEKKKPR